MQVNQRFIFNGAPISVAVYIRNVLFPLFLFELLTYFLIYYRTRVPNTAPHKILPRRDFTVGKSFKDSGKCSSTVGSALQLETLENVVLHFV